MHLKNIYAENELPEAATAKEYLTVQTEGKRARAIASSEDLRQADLLSAGPTHQARHKTSAITQ